MKKILAILLVLSIFACKSKDANQNSKNVDTVQNVATNVENTNVENTDTENTETDAQPIELKYIPDILKSKPKVADLFDVYYRKLTSSITNEDQIAEIFALRDSLISDLSTIIEDYYWEHEGDYDTWDKVDVELRSVGFLPIYAEGMYMSLANAPILEDEIEKVCSTPFKLEIKFMSNYDAALGGEYPYMNLSEYFDAFGYGEKLYNEYKQTKYYKDIEAEFIELLRDFTDIHNVTDIQTCCVFDFNADFYPFGADCELPQKFIKTFPNSKFKPIFEKIMQNMSYLESKTTDVYAVEIERTNDMAKGEEKIFKYLEQGYDIVHLLRVKKNTEDLYILAYRFYPDKDEAEQNMQKITKDFPDASILHIKINSEEYSATID